MRKIFTLALGTFLVGLSWQVLDAATPKKRTVTKKAVASSTTKKRTAVTAKPASSKSGTRSTTASRAAAKTPVTKASAAKHGRKPIVPKVTWRNRQMSPAPERFREIQQALADKGYLSAAEADGSWNGASAEALKRFQADQKLEANGKINSLSLIALGLGPKRDTSAALKPPVSPDSDR